MKNACLIVIDMQEGFRYPESESIIVAIQTIRPSFDSNVLFTGFKDRPGSMIEKQTGWKKFQQKINWPIMKEFNSVKKVFWHKTYTVLTKELISRIKKNKIKTIYLSGIYTDVCILKTAMDAFDYQLNVKVISDATQTLNRPNHHQETIQTIEHVIGKQNVTTVKEILSSKK